MLCIRRNRDRKQRRPGKISVASWKITRKCIHQCAGAEQERCLKANLSGKQCMNETGRMCLTMLCSSWQRKRKKKKKNKGLTTGNSCYRCTTLCLPSPTGQHGLRWASTFDYKSDIVVVNTIDAVVEISDILSRYMTLIVLCKPSRNFSLG